VLRLTEGSGEGNGGTAMTQHMSMQGNMNMDMGRHGNARSMEQPMSHHMVVFGHESVFMSHLAMFSVPEHAYTK
jgi:hypothetical protein